MEKRSAKRCLVSTSLCRPAWDNVAGHSRPLNRCQLMSQLYILPLHLNVHPTIFNWSSAWEKPSSVINSYFKYLIKKFQCYVIFNWKSKTESSRFKCCYHIIGDLIHRLTYLERYKWQQITPKNSLIAWWKNRNRYNHELSVSQAVKFQILWQFF